MKAFDPKGVSPGGQPLAVEYREGICPRCHSGIHQLHTDLAVLSQCASPVCDWVVVVTWATIEQEKRAL